MMTPPAHQRIPDKMDAGREKESKKSRYQQQIDELLDKTCSPADRLKSISILLESKLQDLLAYIDRYDELLQIIDKHSRSQNHSKDKGR